MGQVQYLIDTNAVIDYLAGRIPASGTLFMDKIVDAQPRLSVITKIEVLGFKTSDTHHRLLLDFMNDSKIFDLTDEVVEECIILRRSCKIKLPDAIIAATALAHKLTLITRNISDFKLIPELSLLDLHEYKL